MSSAQKNTPHFEDLSINVDSQDELLQGCFDLVERIRPDWQRSGFKHKHFTDGVTNVLLGVHVGQDQDDMVMVRVYGANTEAIIDREAELQTMRLFDEQGCGTAIYATFANGLAYAFIPGVILNKITAHEPDVSQLVIEMLVKMHKMEAGGGEKVEPCLWQRMRSVLDKGPDGFPDDPVKTKRCEECNIMPKSQIWQEIAELEHALRNSNSPVVFCHNDLLLSNIIHDTRSQAAKKVTIIDYEYCAYNYQAYDIGNHFGEFGFMGDLDKGRCEPDEAFQKDWLRRYLMAYHGKAADEVTEESVHAFFVLVNKFSLCANLWWGLWAMFQAKNSAIDIDFIKYASRPFKKYRCKKSKVLAMI